MTDADSLTAYLHQQVPLTRAMQVHVVSVTPSAVQLGAPLEPNINLHGTAFGGSLATLAVMAGWCAADSALKAHGAEFSLVIQSCKCDFLAPATGELRASAELSSDAATALAVLERKGKARLETQAVVSSGGREVLRMQGTYAAIR